MSDAPIDAPPLVYGGFIQNIASAFDGALAEIEAEYNFDLGPEFEIALCRVLRRVLPQRFGVCRGFVVNRRGETAGDDIIIYERMRFPTARLLCEDLSRKEKIPIEATLAYIEAKHTLEINGDSQVSLTHALEQVAKVKALCAHRPAVPLNEIADSVVLGSALTVTAAWGWPTNRNPLYTAIMSRHVRINKGDDHVTDPKVIKVKLEARSEMPDSSPDLIVAGRSNVVVPNFSEGSNRGISVSPFLLIPGGGLVACIGESVAFGLAIATLLWALDYIRLGPMPWQSMFENAIKR